MKWILAILLLISATVNAQIGLRDDSTKYIRYQYQYGSRMPRFWADSAFHLPYFDTAIVKPQKAGAMMMHLDKNVYKWNGGGWESMGSAPQRFGLEDNSATANRTFNANGNNFNIDSVGNWNVFSKSKTSGADRGALTNFGFNTNNSINLWSYIPGSSTRSYGFNAYGALTQMFAAGHVSGHATYVQSDTLQVILEADPNRLYMFHDSVALHNITGGAIDFRIRTLPQTVDTTNFKPLAIGPLGQVKRFTGWAGSGGGSLPPGDYVTTDPIWKRQGIIHYPTPSEQDYAEPTVLYDSLAQVLAVPSTQKVFKMWYTSGWAVPQIDYAESVDGRQWVKYSGNPVIYNHCREAIVKDGSNYYIYADSSITGTIVNRFVSTDGVNFTKDHGNMISPGANGSWNTSFGNIWVHKDGSQWRMLIDGLCDTLAYTLGLYTSSNGYDWTPYAGNPVIRTISAPWFVKKGTRYWLWGHHVGNREYTPNDIYCAYSDDSLKTWHMKPFGPAYSRLTYDEGVDSVGGGVGDVCLVEARDSVYMFHAAATDALHASGESHFKLAIASLPFDSLVNTYQNMPSTNNQRWISQNNKMYYNLGAVGIGTAIPEGALDILENVNNFTPASVNAMNHISTRNNLALFGYNARYYNGRYNRIKPGETAMAIGVHQDGIIADKFTDTDAAQSPTHLGGWLHTGGVFYNLGHLLIGTSTDNGLGSALQVTGNVDIAGNVRSAGTYNGAQVNLGAGAFNTNIAIGGGNSVLQANTTGEFNSAYGNSALNSNTTGAGNTGIGFSSMTLNTTGSYNTAIGQLSLQSLTTGNYNCGVGRAVWNNLTTGSGNVGSGHVAGTAVTSGDNNVAIGYSAFYTDGTTASSNVSGSAAIGYNAQVTQANSGVLGGIDANGFGMRWGIGVTAPGAWLHLPAGKTTAGFAPLKFTSGSNLTTPEAGAVEYNGTDYFVTNGTARYTLSRTLKGTTNWTPGVVSAGNSTSTTVTVTGAAVGDPVTVCKLAGYSNGEIYDAFVSASNTVTIRVHNVSTGSANYSSAADYNVVVFKY